CCGLHYPTNYQLPVFSVTFPLSTNNCFVFCSIPALCPSVESRPFVFIDIPAPLCQFWAFDRSYTLKDSGRNVTTDQLHVFHLRAIVLARWGAREAGRFLPQPQQNPHFAIYGAVQSGF